MATAASQTYIAKLGFADPDRAKDRHGLACEYLLERLIELEVAPAFYAAKKQNLEEWSRISRALREHYEEELSALSMDSALQHVQSQCIAPKCISVPIKTGYRGSQTAGFADVLTAPLEVGVNEYSAKLSTPAFLGEVKITKQPAETVLQQINYYRQHIEHYIEKVYVLTDYDCSDLQRLAQGSDISAYRLGRRFGQWITARSMPATPEL